MSNSYSNGKYQAEILGQGFEESSAKGTPAFALRLKILGRYDAGGQLQDCPQYERAYMQYLNTETGINILKGDLRTLEVHITDLAQLEPGNVPHVSLVGRKIDVICELEAYKGRQQERWRIPRSRKRLNLDAVRALNDQYGHLLRNGDDQARPAPGTPAPNDSDAAF